MCKIPDLPFLLSCVWGLQLWFPVLVFLEQLPYRNEMEYVKYGKHIDECCGKMDLFSVQNRVVHILSWGNCCQVYQIEGDFMKGGRISVYFDTK